MAFGKANKPVGKRATAKQGASRARRKAVASSGGFVAAITLANRPILRWSFVSMIVLGLMGLVSAYLYWLYLLQGVPNLPPKDALWQANREPAIEFLDANSDTIAIRGPRYGRAIDLSELPPHVARSFIAAEDKRYYEHDGADTTAMFRAAVSNVWSGKTVSGASTITQQLVKNLVLSPERSMKRKVQEIHLARQLEEEMSKDEILELYLNRVYFGSGFYGLGAASRFYFAKEPRDLTLAEASLLATLPKAPSRLALDDNFEGAKTRQAYVLSEMVSAGFVTQQSADRAFETAITLADTPERESGTFGFLLDLATEHASRLRPNLPDDLIISLSIDKDMQTKVTTAVDARMDTESEPSKAGQAAAVLYRRDGSVLAVYGGRDYDKVKFNRATQAKRQPGSAFKPFVYAAALEADITPYDVRIDQPIIIDDWSPKNFNRSYIGPVTLAEALRDSLNTVAAQLGQDVGEDAVIGIAKKFGIKSDLRPLPSIALGSQEVSLWELTAAYGPFMKSGQRLDPYLITKIADSKGKVLYERPEYESGTVISKKIASQMTGMLAEVVRDGTGKNAVFGGWDVAGKTGTSQSSRDAWFIGYSNEILGGVWTGNDDDTPMNKVTGGGLPAKLWADIMTVAHVGRSPKGLKGAKVLATLDPEQQARVNYYRDLGLAFGGTASRQ